MARMVSAVYESHYIAKKAVQELNNVGFERDFIRVAFESKVSQKTKLEDLLNAIPLRSEIIMDDVQTGGSIGAGIGAAIGLALGVLICLGIIHLPGINAYKISDAILALLGSGTAGALAFYIPGTLLGGSIGLGIPDNEAEQYARNVCAGGVQVTVFTDRSTVDQALDILNQFNPLEIKEESTTQIKPGWAGLQPPNSSAPFTSQEDSRRQ